MEKIASKSINFDIISFCGPVVILYVFYPESREFAVSKIRNFSEKSKHFSKINANGDEKCHFSHSYELVFSHDR